MNISSFKQAGKSVFATDNMVKDWDVNRFKQLNNVLCCHYIGSRRIEIATGMIVTQNHTAGIVP